MYTLLTGATGMLGRYVMRDLLLRGCNTAVLVRPGRRESAVDRVEAALHYWEDAWKRTLPRPVVLTGDITQQRLGLSQPDQRWLAANCESIIHSAASLTFYEEEGEPWLSNVEGVRHVLDVCRQLNVRKLYHVSTAYTCGLRDGTIYEDELDVGQEFGNDYERSKVQAETLIREASFLDVAAFFRPSIIVGDSETGFSSTFHGFYTPLRLISALQTQLSHQQVFELDYMTLLGLAGDEGKNFVPVNWVSRAIVSIIERAPDCSQTYALASQSPVLTARMFEVIRAVAERHDSKKASPAQDSPSPLAFPLTDPVLAAYLEQLSTYRSYWRNDPIFDCTNTTAVLPDLPCPVLSVDILTRLSEWAVQAKFSAPFGPKKRLATRGWLQADRSRPLDEPENPRVITISGTGGGSWTFDPSASAVPRICDGRLEGAPELCISSEVFGRIVAHETTLEAAAQAGDLVTIGRACDVASWQRLLDPLISRCATEDRQAVNLSGNSV